MNESPSHFYPPRAKWYNRGTYSWMAFRRATRLDRVRLPGDIGLFTLMAGLVWPGHALFFAQRPAWGWATVAAWSLCALVFVAALGYTVSNIAFGLMVAAHVNSALFLLKRMGSADEDGFSWVALILGCTGLVAGAAWFVSENVVDPGAIFAGFLVLLTLGLGAVWLRGKLSLRLGRTSARIMLAVATLVFYLFCVYRPALRIMEARVLVPLRVDNRVVVVNRLARLRGVTRGQYVAYEIQPGYRGARVRLQAGFGFDKVLALPGETVRFTPTTLEINGQEFPRLSHMPVAGEVRVPQKHWFVWPRVGIRGHGYASEAEIASALRIAAMVSEDHFIGRPFRYWFGRRQVLP